MKTTNTKNIERRGFASELRHDGEADERRVTGYAAVYNKRSENLGGFTEIIQRGAFDDAISSSDVRALFNHDDNLLLARTSSNTLELSVDDNGLRYSFIAPNTQAGNDLLEMLKRGDVNQSSFGFTIAQNGDTWEENKENGAYTRTITKVDRLYDVSPVTFPAYPDTTVAQRSLKELQNEKGIPAEVGPELISLPVSQKRIDKALKDAGDLIQVKTTNDTKQKELELLKIRASL